MATRETIVLDSGALSALAEGHKTLRVAIGEAIDDGVPIVVPTIVIAESTTGSSRDASVNRFISKFAKVDLTEDIARAAARLRYLCKGSGIADAVIVATSDTLAATIITGDPKDLRRLAHVTERSKIIAI